LCLVVALRLDARERVADIPCMGRTSRTKGAAGEREAAAAWHAATGCAAHRSAQRVGRHGDADLQTAAPVHIECKRYASIAALRFLEQAERDAASGAVPVVLMRQDGDTEWVLMLRLRNLDALRNAIDAGKNTL